MKRLSILYISLLLLVTLLLLVGCMTENPAMPESTHNTTQTIPNTEPSESAPSTTPEEKLVTIPITLYRQEPLSGEYVQFQETSRDAAVGSLLKFNITPPEHYEFDLEKSRLLLESVQEGDSILVYFKCQTVEATFVNGDSTVTQTLRCGQTPTPPEFSRYGYTLKGFDKTIEPLYQNAVYTAEWELTLYTITLYTAEGSSVADESFTQGQGYFQKQFSIFDSFSLPLPQNESYAFLAWNTASDRSGQDVTEIEQDTSCNIALYAIYDVTLYEIAFLEENGTPYPSYYLPYGTKVTAPRILPENQIAGYGLTWYEDKDCTKPYHFSAMPRRNITLYGKWERDTGTGFLSWNLDDIASETIDNREELLAFIDYVHFYNLTEGVRIEVTYADSTTVMQDIAAAGMLGDFRANGAIGYGAGTKTSYRHANAKCYLEIKVTNSHRDTEATQTSEPTNEKTCPYLAEGIIPRGKGHTDFYIDSLPLGIAVRTTNQLHYVVEHGYRPIPEKGSPAERIYLTARQLLNEILPADATDFEKVELIYLYLVQNVKYDDRAVQISETPGAVWSDYDAFFLEGVFDSQKAVCDGIAKAFSLLCNIEGIPCVEIVGANHAWNRVKINNLWYVADATHGNLHIANKNYSVTDFSYFLMSDAKKASLGYTGTGYPLIQAEEDYPYYANKTFSYSGYTFDYVIENTDELVIFLAYLLTLQEDLEGCCIDFSYTARFTSLSSAYQSALRTLNRSGIDCPYRITIIDPSFGSAYKIVFTK